MSALSTLRRVVVEELEVRILRGHRAPMIIGDDAGMTLRPQLEATLADMK